MKKALLILLTGSMSAPMVNAQGNVNPGQLSMANSISENYPIPETVKQPNNEKVFLVSANSGADSISFKIKDGYFYIQEGPTLYRRLDSGFEEHNLAKPVAVSKSFSSRFEETNYLILVYITKDRTVWQAKYDLEQGIVSGITSW
jgi:hypothetical protein